MRTYMTSVYVDDQDKALTFYTEVLGFVKKMDMAAGEGRWITVVSPEGAGDVELLLEPMAFPAAETYQKELFEADIPFMSFAVEDIQKEYERMKNLGVEFSMEPTEMGSATIAIFNDTCGNLIQMAQA